MTTSMKRNKTMKKGNKKSRSANTKMVDSHPATLNQELPTDIICMTKSMYHVKTAVVFGLMALLLLSVMDNENKNTIFPIIILFLATAALSIVFALLHPSHMVEILTMIIMIILWFLYIYLYEMPKSKQ